MEDTKFNVLDKARIEYISSKILTDEEKKNIPVSSNLEIYENLVELFGEETMLELSDFNKDKLAKQFQKYNGSLEMFVNEYEAYDKAPELEKGIYFETLQYMLNIMKQVKKMKEELEIKPTDKAQEYINEFKKVLNNCNDISPEFKEKMIVNLEDGVKEVEETKLDERYAGLYHSTTKTVQIDNVKSNKNENQKYKNGLHELMHAATTNRDKLGRTINIGLCSKYKNYGNALNEGATEYFAQKMYSTTGRAKVYVAYLELVAIFEDLVNLYGENVMLDAMLNGPEKLEDLMEKDGKHYSELLEISEDYYGKVYCNKDKILAYKLKKEVESKEMYAKVGCFIEEIKVKRQLENPLETSVDSEWEKAYYELLGMKKSNKEHKLNGKNNKNDKNNKVSWFQKFKSVIKEKFNFNKKDELLALNKGIQMLGQENSEKVNLVDEKKAFKNSIKVENEKQEDHIKQENENENNKLNEDKNENER